MNRKNILFAGLLSIVILSPLIAGCSKNEEKPEYDTVKITRGDIRVTIPAEGSIVPESSVQLQSEIGGMVKAVHFDVGEPVQEGDLVIELRDDDYRMGVQRAESRVAEARAYLKSLEDKPGKLEVVSAQNRLHEAEQKLDFETANMTRVKELHKAGFRSDAQLDSSNYDYDSALQQMDAAKDYLAELMEGATDQEIAAARSQLDTAVAELNIAKKDLSKTLIYAPLSGLVITKTVEPGDAVSPGTAQGGTSLMRIADNSTLYFEGTIDETDIRLVSVGQKAEIKVDAIKDKMFEGIISSIAPAAQTDNQGGGHVVFPIKVEIQGGPEEKNELRTGMRADAVIELSRVDNVLLAPLFSVKYFEDKEVVYTPPISEEGEAKRISVTTGADDGKMIEIKEGLKEGQEIFENYFPEATHNVKGKKKKKA